MMSLYSESALRRIGVVTIACFSLLTSGCFNYVHIKPEEAEKLNGLHGPTYAGSTGYATIYQTTVVNVEREDGRLYQVQGKAHLLISKTDGSEILFKHPLSVEANPALIEVSSKNRPKTRLYSSAIEDVVVKDYDEVDSALLATGISLAASGVIAGIVFAAIPRI